MKLTETITTNFYITDCASCGVRFAITERLEKERREDGHSFYCPNGHSLSFGGGEVARLKKQKAALEFQLADARTVYRDEVAAREKVEEKLKRTKKRIANGACPCCHRQFVNLHRHMAGKHPDYTVTP